MVVVAEEKAKNRPINRKGSEGRQRKERKGEKC